MARLVLSLDNRVLAEYNMNKNGYTIGRLPKNNIRINNRRAPVHHSLIIKLLTASFTRDLTDPTGPNVNGKLIKKHALQHGDVVTVGHHQLRFVEDDEAQDEFEKTMVIQPSSRPAAEKMRAAKDTAEKVSADLSASGARKGLDGKVPVKKAKLQVLSGSFAGPSSSSTRPCLLSDAPASRWPRSRAVPMDISSCTSTAIRLTTIRWSTAPPSAARRASSSTTM